MPVVFPHANNFQISDEHFRQAWENLLREHDHNFQGPELPHLHRRWSLAEMNERGYQLGLEYLLRTLVPVASQNTAQATRVFLAANGFEFGYINKDGLHLYTKLYDTLHKLGLNYNCQLGSLNVVYHDPT